MVGFPVMKLPELSAGQICSNPFVYNHNPGARIYTILALFIVHQQGGKR